MLLVSNKLNTRGSSWMREKIKICHAYSGRVEQGKSPTVSKNGYTKCYMFAFNSGSSFLYSYLLNNRPNACNILYAKEV